MTADESPTVPYCTWVIAHDYYDGAIDGVGLRNRDRTTVYFRAVAWDDDEWFRVFAVTPVSDAVVGRFRAVLARIAAPEEPFWLPGPGADKPEVNFAWKAVLAEAHASGDWRLIECRSPVDPARETAAPAELSAAVGRMVQRGMINDIDDPPLLPVFLDQLRGSRL